MTDFFDAATVACLIGFFPLWILTTYAHELGHVGFGVLAGFRPRAVGSGISGRAISFRVRGLVFYQSTGNFSQGLTLAGLPALVPDRWRTVLYNAGGILANLIVGAVAGSVWVMLDGRPAVGSVLVCLFAVLNLLSGAVNLLPLAITIGTATLTTDGRNILNAIRRKPGLPIANTVNVYRVLLPLLTTLGDRTTRAALGFESARFWAMLGRPKYGRTFLQDEPADGHPLDRAVNAYGRFWLAAVEENLPEAEAELAASGELFVRAGDRTGQALVALSRVDVLTGTGRHDEAARLLDELTGPEWQTVGLKLDLVRDLLAAKAAAVTGDTAAADRLLALAEAVTVDPAVRSSILRDVGGAFAKAGLWVQTERAERLNATAVAEVAAVLADPADKAEIAAVHAEGCERVRRAVAAQGKEPEPDAVLDAMVGERATAARQRFLSMIAFGIAAAAFLIGMAGVIGLGLVPFARTGREPSLTKPIILSLALVFAVVWWGFLQVCEWAWFRLRRKPRVNYGVSALVSVVMIQVVVPLSVVYAIHERDPNPRWTPPAMTDDEFVESRRAQLADIRKARAALKKPTDEQLRALDRIEAEIEKQIRERTGD